VSESNEDLKRRVAELEGELKSEKAKQKKDTYLKVSQKGAVSLYGIRRFPVTFYQEEWDRILGMADDIRSFIAEHEAELTRKG